MTHANDPNAASAADASPAPERTRIRHFPLRRWSISSTTSVFTPLTGWLPAADSEPAPAEPATLPDLPPPSSSRA